MANKRIAILGAGVGGLCAARHCSNEESLTCVVYDQTPSLGGTWVYTDENDVDKHGLPIHSSMYKSLKTNLPKEAMSFPDFPHTNTDSISYLPNKDVLKYLNDYTKHFKLEQYIKFSHQVKLIDPLENDRWQLTVVDLNTNEERKELFDGVMICSGRNTTPRYPNVIGKDIFEGKQTHSHHYREPTPYVGLNLLIIGAGPSGLDLTLELSKVAVTVYLSHHSKYADKLQFPNNVVLKPDVASLTKNSVIFKDGSESNIDVIFYCTGYSLIYPYLSKNCKIKVEDNFIEPMYRHLISIEHPTLCIIGLPKNVPVFHLVHIHSQFFIKTLNGQITLPSKEEMYKELDEFVKKKQEKGVRTRDFMALNKSMEEYYNYLAKKAGVTGMSTIFGKMYHDAYDRIFNDFMTFRNLSYKIIDDAHYKVVDIREKQKGKSEDECATTVSIRSAERTL